MNVIKKKIAVVGLSTLLLAAAGSTLAFGGHRSHGGHDRYGDCHQGGSMAGHTYLKHGRGMLSPMAIFKRVDNLTDEQRQSIKEIYKGSRQSLFDVVSAMQDNRLELNEARQKADIETIRALAKKQGEQVERMIVLRAETRAKVNAVLTEEQRKQLKSKRRSGRDGEGKGKGRGMRS